MHGRHYRNMLTHAHGPRGSPFSPRRHLLNSTQKPMEAVDPATENSICEAGITHKQDRNDSVKFHERKITFIQNIALWRIIAHYGCILTSPGGSLSPQHVPICVRTNAQVAQMKQSRENAGNLFRSLSTGRWFPGKKSTPDAMVPLNFAVDAS